MQFAPQNIASRFCTFLDFSWLNLCQLPRCSQTFNKLGKDGNRQRHRTGGSMQSSLSWQDLVSAQLRTYYVHLRMEECSSV